MIKQGIWAQFTYFKNHRYFSNFLHIQIALHCTFSNHLELCFYDQNWPTYEARGNGFSNFLFRPKKAASPRLLQTAITKKFIVSTRSDARNGRHSTGYMPSNAGPSSVLLEAPTVRVFNNLTRVTDIISQPCEWAHQWRVHRFSGLYRSAPLSFSLTWKIEIRNVLAASSNSPLRPSSNRPNAEISNPKLSRNLRCTQYNPLLGCLNRT
jgi:hypothetical protein